MFLNKRNLKLLDKNLNMLNKVFKINKNKLDKKTKEGVNDSRLIVSWTDSPSRYRQK